jgi:hypothetical protein
VEKDSAVEPKGEHIQKPPPSDPLDLSLDPLPQSRLWFADDDDPYEISKGGQPARKSAPIQRFGVVTNENGTPTVTLCKVRIHFI